MEDILTRLENSSATETDMAELGAAFMDAIKSHADVGWHPMNCPSEIVGDLRNERDELQEEIKRLREIFTTIANLESGRDDEGSFGPKPPISHESVAMIAFDCAHVALTTNKGPSE